MSAVLLGGPPIAACASDPRGIAECLRDSLETRFRLREAIEGSSGDETTPRPVDQAVEAAAPEPAIDPTVDEQVADEAIVDPPVTEPPPLADPPAEPAPRADAPERPVAGSATPAMAEPDRLAVTAPADAMPEQPVAPLPSDPGPATSEPSTLAGTPQSTPEPENLAPDRPRPGPTIVADIPPAMPAPRSDAVLVPTPAETATVAQPSDVPPIDTPDIAALPRIFYDRPQVPAEAGSVPPQSVPYVPMPPPLEPMAPRSEQPPAEAPAPVAPDAMDRGTVPQTGPSVMPDVPVALPEVAVAAPQTELERATPEADMTLPAGRDDPTDTAAGPVPAPQAAPVDTAETPPSAEEVAPSILVPPDPAPEADLARPDDRLSPHDGAATLPDPAAEQRLAAVGDEDIALDPPQLIEAPPIEPTIDAIEIDGLSSFFAGDGPEGAEMHLFVDDVRVGSGAVAGGRWVVEARDILRGGEMTIRVDAVDEATGEMLGSATILIEIALPADAVDTPASSADPEADELVEGEAGDGAGPTPDPSAEDEPPAGSAPSGSRNEQNEDEAGDLSPPPARSDSRSETPDEPEEPTLAERALSSLPDQDEPSDVAGTEPQSPQALAPETPSQSEALPPAQLPPLAPRKPTKASDSVEILPRPEPRSPAIIADLTVPSPAKDATRSSAGAAPSIIVLLPQGDPTRARFRSGKAIIRPGDTLWAISRRYYGRGIHYDTIVNANRRVIRRPSRIYPGQVLDLPLVFDD